MLGRLCFMEWEKKTKNFKWNYAFIIVAFIACAGAIWYAASKISGAVSISVPPSDNGAPVIVLDAGHGGMDGGCSTADGITEKGINLNITLTVKDMCGLFGYETEATRQTDTSIHDKGITGTRNQKVSDMKNRLDLFNKYPDSVCVSIHQNTFSDPRYSGAQMFYSGSNPANEKLASIMQSRFVSYLQPENTRETKLCGPELYLCHYCDNPTVMIECGFLSNPDEAGRLINEAYQKQVAFTIFSGLNEFVGGGI